MPAKFDRCVRKVRRKSRGRVNAYAVCTAAGTRNPKGPKLPIYSLSITQALRVPQVWSLFHHLAPARRAAAKEGSEFIGQVKDSQLKHVGYQVPYKDFTLEKLRELMREPGTGFRAHETNPAGRKGRKSNPESTASDMYSSFHGSPSEEVVEFREEEHYHGNLAGLGVLVELKLVTTTGYDVTLTFSDPEALIAANPGLWDRLKSIGSRSTTYSVPKHVEKMVKVASAKGHEIFKTVHGDYRVPSLERESSFDTLGDAKKFVGAWKGNPRPAYYVVEKRPSDGKKSVKAGPFRDKARAKHHFNWGDEILTYKQVEALEESGQLRADELDWRGWSRNPSGRHYPDELRIMGSIREGEMILKSKRAGSGRKMSPAELGAVQRAVDNSKSRLAQLQAENDARYGTQNPGPFQSASSVLGRTGRYLDDQLGRVLNPTKYVSSEEEAQKLVDRFRKRGIPASMQYAETKQGKERWKVMYEESAIVHRPNPSQDPTLLCSNESGTQLYLQGGDQSVDLKTIHMADVPLKDSMVLGEAYFISYFTTKDFDGHKPTIYEHDLAEESDPPKPKYRKDEIHTAANRPGMGQGLGCYPMVRYDHLNQKLYLDGGEYKIEKPLFNTSPGIEN